MKDAIRRIAGALLSIVVMLGTVCSVSAGDDVKTSEATEGVYTVTGNMENVPDILGESAIVVDMKTGYTLYEKNIYAKRYPASITKLMTALLTIEQAAMSETVTFSHEAVFSVEAGSSIAYVNEGEQLTVEQCLYGLMLISGNDVANGLAEHIGGSMNNFADMMTSKATELGCVGTNFENAHGLHNDNHYTCAYDMAIIANTVYKTYDEFKKICSTLTYECAPTNKQPEVRLWRNKNKLINPYEDLYYEDCIGGKTGYTTKAGGTLVTYANINGRELLCVIMKSSNSSSAFADTTTLYEYVRAHVSSDIFAKLDAKYEAENPPEIDDNISEKPSIEGSTGANAAVTDRETDTSKDKNNGMDIWGRVIIGVVILVVIVGAYYAYIQYQRYLRRKRRRERRMRESHRRHM